MDVESCHCYFEYYFFSFSKIFNKVSLENLLDIVCWKLYDHRT